MKFLATLKDSFREAVDSKVFYVMVGLSLLVTLLAFTMTFTPKPMAREFMQAAAVPLNVDNPEDLAGGDNPEEFIRALMTTRENLYEVVRAEPVGGAADAPSSPFRVTLRAHYRTPAAAEKARQDPRATEDHIRQRFGDIFEMRIEEATAVRMIPRPADLSPVSPHEVYYELDARPTATTRRLWPHRFALFFGALPFGDGGLPLGAQLFAIENWLVGWAGASAAILVSIIITAFFIPNMLRKGTIDLLLVKPIHRTTLLLYKYVGGLTFIFLNTAVSVLGVWLALGARSGVWAPSFLVMIPVITFCFAIFYAVSALFAVLTRSAVVAILLSCAMWALLFIVGIVHGYVEGRRQEEEKKAVPVAERVSENWFAKSVYAVHFVLPRKTDFDHLTSLLLARDLLTNNEMKTEKIDRTRISWAESLTVTGVFIALMLALASWRFATKDY
jgi:ABC-type transport system involved in multi-copper enzyme maturation permease subunit